MQAGQQAPTQARAVLVYMLLALSGHVDDVLPQYKVHSTIQSILPGTEYDMVI